MPRVSVLDKTAFSVPFSAQGFRSSPKAKEDFDASSAHGGIAIHRIHEQGGRAASERASPRM